MELLINLTMTMTMTMTTGEISSVSAFCRFLRDIGFAFRRFLRESGSRRVGLVVK